MGVECLCCGQRRIVERASCRFLQTSECPRCGYLGWAPSSDLDEGARSALRRRPPHRRRLSLVA
ncbi:MAG: hypothetical protein ABR521_01810 [Gaiellaceae bacterium]